MGQQVTIYDSGGDFKFLFIIINIFVEMKQFLIYILRAMSRDREGLYVRWVVSGPKAEISHTASRFI